MSTSNQSNGKKCISNNNSATNTPSNTPVTTMSNPSNQCSIQSNLPLTNAPKYGTLVPNRIFVGGISANTTETELMQLFNNYGTVKAAKIIQDRAGVSKGYGFVTFESEEEAKRLQRESENIVFRERKLNIAPAIKKQQPFSRVFDASSSPAITPGGPTQYFIPTGSVPFYQGGVTYYAQPPPPPPPPGDMNTQQPPVYQAPTVYPAQSTGPPQNAAYPPIVYPSQPIYVPQQFPYQHVPYEYNYHPNGNPQYIMGNQSAHQPPPLQMPSPGSPPRTPCYNSQLPYGSDVMYFNMPFYGAMDGTIYQDTVEVTSANLGEDTNMGPLQALEASSFSHIPSTSDFSTTSDMNRQSTTPVVSLLSLNGQQEKDLTTLRGGRRKKSIDETLNSNTFQFPTNDYGLQYPIYDENSENYYTQLNNTQTSYQNNLSCIPSANDFYSRSFVNQHSDNSQNNYNSNNMKSTWYSGRYRHNSEISNNSSSDTFKPASVVDENHNEEILTTRNTPPPAPYSPISYYSNMNMRSFNRNSSRPPRGRFYSSNRRFNSSFRNGTGAQFTSNKFNSNYNNTYSANSGNVISLNNNEHFTTTKSVDLADGTIINEQNDNGADSPGNSSSHSTSPLPSQITSTSQNCLSSTRRARRNVRRSAHMGPPMTEIGAGDAPIPPSDVGDICKKLDNIKL